MNKLTSLAFSIGILAGVATYFAVGPAAGVFFIWAATIAWAAYFLLGANLEAAVATGVNGIFGVFMAWLTAVLLLETAPKISLGAEISTALIVGAAVIVLCLSANLPQFAVIPVGVLGYSSTFAYLLQTPEKMTQEVLLNAGLNNPLLVISISFILGSVFGHLSNQLANKLNSIPLPFSASGGQ